MEGRTVPRKRGFSSENKGCLNRQKNRCPLHLSGLGISHNLTAFLIFLTPILNHCQCNRDLENIHIFIFFFGDLLLSHIFQFNILGCFFKNVKKKKKHIPLHKIDKTKQQGNENWT